MGKLFSFRIESDLLKDFEAVTRARSINKSELVRQWISKYVQAASKNTGPELEVWSAARKIKSADTWTDCEPEIQILIAAAGLETEYNAADGESFEDIIHQAGAILDVEVV